MTQRQIRITAASADVDQRTVLRALAGLPIRPGCRERLAEALAEQGIDPEALPLTTGATDHRRRSDRWTQSR